MCDGRGGFFRFRFGGLKPETAEAGTGLGGLQARLSEDQLKRETEISFGNKQVIQRGHRELNLSPVTQKPGIRRALQYCTIRFDNLSKVCHDKARICGKL